MKRLFLVLFMTTFALQISAQNVSLYDGMYSQEWQEERDALLREEEQRNAERQRRFQEKLIADTTGLHNKLLNAMRAQEQKAQQQNAAAQQRAAQQRAAHNKQVAIRNAQIKQQKKIRQQQLAQQRRQQQIEAERERQERARIKAEQERIKREETRQRVTAETYQSLEHQTRTFQEAAEFASGYGAERMRAEQDVSRYESQVLQGTGNAISQMDHLPRQKFEMPQNTLVIDPNRRYFLDTWHDDYSDYLRFSNSTPPAPRNIKQETWNRFYGDIPTNRAMTYVAMMTKMCDGNMPDIYEGNKAYVFLSSDGNTVFKIAKDGKSMHMVDLDDPENAEYKNKLYAEANMGGIMKTKTQLNGDNPNSEFTLNVGPISTNVNNKGVQVSGDVKVKGVDVSAKVDNKGIHLGGKINIKDTTSIDEKFDFRSEKEKKERNIGVSICRELERDDMSKLKYTYVRFVTENNAVVLNVGVDAGTKLHASASAGAKVSTSMKADAGVNVSAGFEGIAGKGSVGYLRVSKKGFSIAQVGIRGGLGYSLGGKFGLKDGSIKTGAISFSWNADAQFTPFESK